MTAVATAPSFSNLNRSGWINSGQSLNSMNQDELKSASIFVPRKTMQRSNSASSLGSNSSTSSTSTVIPASSAANGKAMSESGDSSGWTNGAPRKRPQPKGQWAAGKVEGQGDFQRTAAGRPPMVNGLNGPSPIHQAPPMLPAQGQMMAQNGLSRPGGENMGPGRQPVLCLSSLNGTFDRKQISVPFFPETLRIGRQTNAKTVPTATNGFFDSKVLSRQHAEIWADSTGKIFIRDVKSSNGTFVNSNRLSQENRESDPHELQPQDKLELGIDIVSEDQKTVVHHKVAAKVEHAGFLAPSNNIFDTNFGDMDPAFGGGMMMPFGGMPARGRYGSMSAPQQNGRMVVMNAMQSPMNMMAQHRQFWLNPPTVDNIIKRLQNEMRNARLHGQDLQRTQEFIDNLLSHEDIKEKPEVPEKPEAQDSSKNHITNGNASFRSDGGKPRFSDPPAPPPSQPLPEKPDVAKAQSDVPALKRGTTEKPRSDSASPSPVRQDDASIQLIDMLNTARKEAESHSARVRDLEEMLQKEREARLYAEDMVQKLEESSHVVLNGTPIPPLTNGISELDKAFDPPTERPPTPEPSVRLEDHAYSPPPSEQAESSAATLQARMDIMLSEMKWLREQLEAYRQRAEKAEAERDADRKTLAELVMEISKRNEEDKLRAAEQEARPALRDRSRPNSRGKIVSPESASPTANGNATKKEPTKQAGVSNKDSSEPPSLSRANTITPSSSGTLAKSPLPDQALMQTLPYASMIGVVLIGMGLMAYLNGWQLQPRPDR